MCEECGCNNHVHESSSRQLKNVHVNKKITEENDREAAHIREHLESHRILGINMMSSPGSGKTSLLEKTAELIKHKMAVLEGDLETNRDSERIKSKGVPAYQISTGQTCHLDAFMVHEGLHHLDVHDAKILFVENVGNLVCPASYDVWMHMNVVLLSVPEGDDKVAKYPVIFRRADLVLITKTDLIPHFDFHTENITADLRKINPEVKVLMISTKDSASIQAWVDHILTMLGKKYP